MVTQQQREQQLVILTRHANGVTELCLNRPNARNAFSRNLYQTTTSQLESLSKDPKTRIILLTGTGETFCAGMDIKEASSTSLARATIQSAKEFMYALLNMPKIVVAAVSGAVVGIGVTLLMHCDFIYASHRTSFSTPFPRVGLIPEFGASVTFPIWLGPRRAGAVLLMGKTLNVVDMEDIVTSVHGGRKEVVAYARSVCNEWSSRMGDEEWNAVELGKGSMTKRFQELVKRVVDEEIEVIERLVDDGVTERLMKARVSRIAKL